MTFDKPTDRSDTLIFDEQMRKYAPVIRASVINVAKATLLPEVYEAVGPESFLRFMEMFAGQQIRVPEMATLHRMARDTAIYVTLRRSGDWEETVSYLARRYSMKGPRVLEVYKEMAAACQAAGVRVCENGEVKEG